MPSTKTLLIAAAGAALALPSAAAADTTLAPAAGAKNLAYGGGYAAWSAPTADGRHALTLRAPDGTVSTPAVPTSATPLDPALGRSQEKLVVAYSRGGDVFKLPVAGGAEAPVPGLSSPDRVETAPSVTLGRWSFVRRGAGLDGVFTRSERTGTTTRLSPTIAKETATNGSRVLWSTSTGLSLARVGRASAVRIPVKGAHSIGLTRYQATWVKGDAPYATSGFGGSSGVANPESVIKGTPFGGLQSIGVGQSIDKALVLDADGVKQPSKRLFR